MADTQPTKRSVEPLMEELIKEIMNSAGPEVRAPSPDDDITAAFAEAATATLVRTVSHASEYEKALLVGALAPALADALAPALAKALAPEIVSALNRIGSEEQKQREAVPSKSR
jgi:hypothetical protein